MPRVLRTLAIPVLVIIAGLIWDAITDELGPTLVVGLGAIWLVAASEWRNRQLRDEFAPKLPPELQQYWTAPLHVVVDLFVLRASVSPREKDT